MSSKLELALLWEPENLEKNIGYFSFLSIVTNGKVTTYRKGEIDRKNIKNLRSGFSSTYNDFLESIGKEVTQQKIGAAQFMLKKSGGDAGVQKLVAEQVGKHTYSQVEKFARTHHLMNRYQWVSDEKTKNKKLQACEITDHKLPLHFELASRGGRYYAVPFVEIEGQTRALQKEDRYAFMVPGIQKGVWHFLAYKDYKTLCWLEEQEQQPRNLMADKFSALILPRLEQDYKIIKNGHFEIQEVRCAPTCSIQLSELNDSFLVLMPKWSYDHLMVDGTFESVQELRHKQSVYRIYRDQPAEARFIGYVEGLHTAFPAQAKRGFYYLSFAEARKRQWFLKAYRKLLDENVQITGLDQLRNFKYSPHAPSTTMRLVNSTGPSVLLELKVFFDKEQVPVLNIQKMLLAGQHNVLLKDDSIAVFPEDWQQEYGLFIKHAQIEKDKLLLPSWLFWEVQNKKDQTGEIAGKILPDSWRSNWRKWQQSDEVLFAVPEAVQASLRPYQQKGYEWMILLSEMQAGACLADDMGLGKTLQTICFLARQWEIAPDRKSIVICPASLLHNWEQEMGKYLPGKKSCVYRGQGRDFDGFLSGDGDLLIVSYNTARQDIDRLSTYTWQVAIIDESHNIKNTAASITKSVGMIRGVNKVALSGTPVMNNTFDLYAQLNFVLPGLLGSKAFFNNEYVIPIDREGDQQKMMALRNLTSPFILRRTKRQVAKDLPDRTESTLWCEMNEQQRFFYEEAKMSIRDSVFLDVKNEGLGKARFSIIQGLQRLRQICNAPVLLKDAPELAPQESIKIDYLVEMLQGIREEGAKALVFSQFTGMLDLIAESFNRNGIDFYHFDGSTPTEKRHEMVSRFQSEGDEKTAFLISLKAGNAGLNLTAAQYVFLVDPWWNNAVEQQAIDRTHRIGQQSHVFAYRMICKDSIEEKILAIQQKKKMLSDELISAEEGFVKQITEEELMYLFS